MPRTKYQTLTEQMFYTLLALKNECCGTDILNIVKEMTEGRVSIGSGTLYTLLEQFLDEGYIKETAVEGRKRSYIITEQGALLLQGEYERLKTRVDDYNKMWGGPENERY